ncbi:MAG: UDPGP type 1 family protein [Phycisphaerae bacterium]|nr:UDPGP type 1 family protein [Phycisphaerae bacterium]
MDIAAASALLATHGQEHLLGFYEALSPAERTALLEQIAEVDFAQLDRLIATYVLAEPTVPRGEISPPAVVPIRTADGAMIMKKQRAFALGEQWIRQGKVAAFVVAGGQGTRLGYEGPKGCLPATPVRKKPLFQLFAEQLLAANRRYQTTVPLYVMTSPANDVATRSFFRQHGYFGLAETDVFFLVQGTMPAFDFDGKILLESKGGLALSPNGHGGSLTALRKSGALADMASRGVELISYFQVDNPLVRVVDPLFIGLHAMDEAEMSAKVLPKREPLEKLGNVCVVDGRTTVIEYSDMPETLARETTADGHLRFSAGSIAIHILSRPFVEALTGGGGEMALPWHRAAKKVSCVDARGEAVRPTEPNAVKLEMFVFDALPLAKKVVVLETLRSEEFSPIKNASGEDSLASSLHDQVRRAATWLEQAGVRVPRDADGQVAAAIEIGPLLANSAAELAERGDVNPTIASGGTVYLG